MSQAYALINAVTDPREYAALASLLRTLQSVSDSCAENECVKTASEAYDSAVVSKNTKGPAQ